MSIRDRYLKHDPETRLPQSKKPTDAEDNRRPFSVSGQCMRGDKCQYHHDSTLVFEAQQSVLNFSSAVTTLSRDLDGATVTFKDGAEVASVFLPSDGLNRKFGSLHQLAPTNKPTPGTVSKNGCVLCFGDAKDPLEMGCGHFYCNDCFLEAAADHDAGPNIFECIGDSGGCKYPPLLVSPVQ